MPTSIDDLIAKLSILEDKADQANIKINKLASTNAIKGLQQVRATMYGRPADEYGVSNVYKVGNQDYTRIMKIINDKVFLPLREVERGLSASSIGSRGLASTNIASLQKALSEITYVVNGIVAAGSVAERLNRTIQVTKGKLANVLDKQVYPKDAGVYLDPKSLLDSNRAAYWPKIKSAKGLAGNVSITPGTVNAQNVAQDLIHEIAHSADEYLRRGNFTPETVKRMGNEGNPLKLDVPRGYNEQFFARHMQPLIDVQQKVYKEYADKLSRLGYAGIGDEAFVNQKSTYWSKPSEIYARNIASFATTGKAENPELQDYITREFKELPQAFKTLIRNIKEQEYAFREDQYKPYYLDVKDPRTRKAEGIASYLSEEHPVDKIVRDIEDALGNKAQQIKAETVTKVPTASPTVTKTPTEILTNKLETIIRQNMRGGTGTPERIGAVAKEVAGLGGPVQDINRVGAGAYVRWTRKAKDDVKQAMDEFYKSIQQGFEESQSIKRMSKREQELRIQDQITKIKSGAYEGIGKPPPIDRTAMPGTIPTAPPLRTLDLAPNRTEILRKIENTFTNASTAIKEGAGKLWDSVTEIKPGKLVDLGDGFRKLDVALTGSSGSLGKVILYINKYGEALNQQQYQLAKYSPENIRKVMGEYRANKMMETASKYGFTPEQITSQYTLPTKKKPGAVGTGVTITKFQGIDEATGATSRLEVTTDKLGTTIVRTNKRLLGFTDAIIRNTQEVLRWSIGVGLVYGTMYKLQELIRIAISNETKLADIAIILGDAQRDVNEIFDEAAKVARDTGESINAVLDTYTLAYRAVGAVSDPIKRTNTAIQLLTDATVLNKLSSLDAATSIDVLAGSLRQLQKPGENMATAFARGTDLLDSWITLNRKANVDLATLATAFSITSESAENSGVSIEELNAIIASLAEKIGGLGGRETGNAVRALIGGVYQQQAAETLTRYGIAVTDTTGKMRPFLDITKEIYTLYRAGIISSDELNKIGYVLGGGVRRGQQYVAFLSDFDRIQQLVNEQTDRAGASQAALGRKMETTQTSITNLGNAFQSLAQTLGTTGGVLDALGGVLTIATKLVDVFDNLSGVLGSLALPAIFSSVILAMFSGGKGQLRGMEMAGNLGSMLQKVTTGALGITQPGRERITRTSVTGGIITETKAQELGRTFGLWGGKYFSSALIGVVPGIFRALQGDLPGAGVSIAGAMIGALTGSPIGAVIGAMIAETFVEMVVRNRPDFEEFFALGKEGLTTPTGGGLKGMRRSLEKMPIEEQQQMLIDKLIGGQAKGIQSLYPDFLKAAGKNLDTSITAWIKSKLTGEKVTANELLWQQLSAEEQKKVMGLGIKTVPLTPGKDLLQGTKVESNRLALIEQEKNTVDEIIVLRREELRLKEAMGEITPKEALDSKLMLGGLDATLAKVSLAFGETYDKANKSVSGFGETYKSLAQVLMDATEGQKQDIIQAATEWETLTALMEKAQETGQKIELIPGSGIEYTRDEISKMRDDLQSFGDYLNTLGQEQQLSKIKLPSIVGLDLANMKDFKAVLTEAFKGQEQYFNDRILKGILTQEQVDVLKIRAEKLWVDVGKGLPGQLVEGLTDPRFLEEAKARIEDSLTNINLGFQEFDVTNPVLTQLVQQSNVMAEQWKNLYGYQPDYQEQLAITKEGVIQPMKADWKIVQYLLQQILDTEKKQLDGMYNLPEGAGFYVPYQTLDLAYQKGLNEGTGAGAMGNATAPTPLPPYTTAGTQQTTLSDMVGFYNKTTAKDVAQTVTSEMNKVFLPQVTVPQKGYTGPKMPYTGPQFPGTETKGIWDQLIDIFKQFPNYNQVNPFTGEEIDLKGMFDNVSTKVSNIVNMNLNSNSTIQLVVDGKVLADIVKTYLYQDTIAFEGSGGTINRTMVI